NTRHERASRRFPRRRGDSRRRDRHPRRSAGGRREGILAVALAPAVPVACAARMNDGHSRYSLLATRYSLLATRYSLLATRYSLLATRYSSLVARRPSRYARRPYRNNAIASSRIRCSIAVF